MEDIQQRKKSPEPVAQSPAQTSQQEIPAASSKPGNNNANVTSASEAQTERRVSLTNVVRPMIQATVALPSESLTRPLIQPVRFPPVDDTDTSTGGESPVLMRRRSYNNICRDNHNKARHSLPIRAGTSKSLEASPGVLKTIVHRGLEESLIWLIHVIRLLLCSQGIESSSKSFVQVESVLSREFGRTAIA